MNRFEKIAAKITAADIDQGWYENPVSGLIVLWASSNAGTEEATNFEIESAQVKADNDLFRTSKKLGLKRGKMTSSVMAYGRKLVGLVRMTVDSDVFKMRDSGLKEGRP